MITNYSQLDPAWKNVNIGLSPLKLGGYGCTTICVTNAANDIGIPCTPLQAVKKLRYLLDGRILWASVENVGLKFEWRGYNFNQAKIKQALKDPLKRVLLEVNIPSNAKLRHWVLVNERVGSKYEVRDPLGGFIAVYPSPKHPAITGYAILSGKHIEAGGWIASIKRTFPGWIASIKRTFPDWINIHKH